jgi:hypothetical protein
MSAKWSTHLRVLLNLLFLIAFAVVSYGQPPQPAEMSWIEDMYLAKDDGNGKAGIAATNFGTKDIPIYCVVILGSASPVSVKMNLVAVAVAGVKAERNIVSTIYQTKDNQNRVNFSGRPDKQWIAGKYRADIFINDTLVKKLDFEIRKPAAPIKSALSYQPKQPSKPKAPPSKRN